MRRILMFAVVASVIVTACKKTDDYVNPVFMCECGGFTWQGSPYDLLMAEYVQLGDDLPLSRRYYATAEIHLEGELAAHNLNYTFDIDTVTQSVFFVAADTIPFIVEEINFNDDLLPYRKYIATDGIISIAPAIFGGTESIQFEVTLKEEFNGQLVGFDIPFAGSMAVGIDL